MSQAVNGCSNDRIYMLRKAKHSKYTWCNEACLEILGFDSPKDILGKSDIDFTWSAQAELYNSRDAIILQGLHQNCVLEPQDRNGRLHTVMASKHPIYNRQGDIVELICCFTDIDEKSLIKKPTKKTHGRLHLGPLYSNAVLSPREHQILRLMLQGIKPHIIQQQLNIKKSTYDSIVQRIKHKMGCQTIGDILFSAVQTQLIHQLFQPDTITY